MSFQCPYEPEVTSLVRATNSNEHNVGKFYDNLDDIMKRYEFELHNIWNFDEKDTQQCRNLKRLSQKEKQETSWNNDFRQERDNYNY